MKKRVVLFLVSCLLLCLDNTFAPFIAIRGAWPSFLFVFAIGYSLINGREESIIIALMSGILQDIFFSNVFGINCFINLILCYFVAIVGEKIWREKSLVPIIIALVTTVFKFLGVYIIFYFLKENISLKLFRGMLSGLYNSVIMFLFYRLMLKFFYREDKRSTWRF
ncbi:MAG: rod shape-determining protein MreD [Clostridiaceae bacterium]|nr:rod shape-determining protein MreD [Clostridiaceae bacterium]